MMPGRVPDSEPRAMQDLPAAGGGLGQVPTKVSVVSAQTVAKRRNAPGQERDSTTQERRGAERKARCRRGAGGALQEGTTKRCAEAPRRRQRDGATVAEGRIPAKGWGLP
jgi:hypothetical protein